MTVKQLGRRVGHWQRVLRLQHWDIKYDIVTDFPDSPEACARCHCEDSYDQATISFKLEWWDYSTPEEVDVIIVHELLHVYMRNFDHAIERIDDQLSRCAADIWNEQVKHERENMVDRLARLIVALHAE